jgi:outer membrane lipoprotein-sorting protein
MKKNPTIMRTFIPTILLILAIFPIGNSQGQDAREILERVDRNMFSENRVVESSMTIHGRRGSRNMEMRTYSVGDEKSFTEYLSPPREAGTKMLKLENQLWIYSPSTDRTIQISGHMLRQSVMGSDLSYEDMMEDRKLLDIYEAVITGEENIGGRQAWVLHLEAIVDDATYHSQKIWIDKERYVPVRQEMYAKSGQLLKETEMRDVRRIGERWFPTTIIFKDALKQGDGTELRMTDIRFDQDIPEYIFTKAVLR